LGFVSSNEVRKTDVDKLNREMILEENGEALNIVKIEAQDNPRASSR
jgi:hypothetical protein